MLQMEMIKRAFGKIKGPSVPEECHPHQEENPQIIADIPQADYRRGRYYHEILQRFNDVLKSDYQHGRAKDWMAAWYWKELCPQFGDSKDYKGPVELVNWYVGQSTCRKYFDNVQVPNIKQLAQTASNFDKKIFSHQLFDECRDSISKIDFHNYSTYTAQDYFFQNLLPLNENGNFRTVLDFGAGSGRQFSFWSSHHGLEKFISAEGIPQTYCMQHLYYSLSCKNYYDYVLSPNQFKVECDDSFALFHLPSWRLDLVQPNSVDLIIAVQVLGELRPQMLEYCLNQFHRILRTGGRLYIRDHGMHHCPNKIDIPAEVSRRGFALELHPRYADRQDIWGIPKVWAKC